MVAPIQRRPPADLLGLGSGGPEAVYQYLGKNSSQCRSKKTPLGLPPTLSWGVGGSVVGVVAPWHFGCGRGGTVRRAPDFTSSPFFLTGPLMGGFGVHGVLRFKVATRNASVPERLACAPTLVASRERGRREAENLLVVRRSTRASMAGIRWNGGRPSLMLRSNQAVRSRGEISRWSTVAGGLDGEKPGQPRRLASPKANRTRFDGNVP